MKSIFTLLAIAAIALTSCQNPNPAPEKPSGKLDPNAMISLRPDTKQAANVATKANPEHLTPLEIVKQANSIWFWNREIIAANALGRGFDKGQRDTVNVRLLMFGDDIISRDGEYMPDFIEGEDAILTRLDHTGEGLDTIAYMPNSVLRTNQPLIKAAQAIGDYSTCYRLFDEALTFIPITGAEWLELKAQGLN